MFQAKVPTISPFNSQFFGTMKFATLASMVTCQPKRYCMTCINPHQEVRIIFFMVKDPIAIFKNM